MPSNYCFLETIIITKKKCKMNYESLIGSIVGFNGTTNGRAAITSEELRDAWLLSKLKNKKNGTSYLELYEEYYYDRKMDEEIDELLYKLKKR